jgi:methionyl-tRNA synthetase
MANKPFYITTTLPYVNADPHIGFALEIVQADAIARYKRLMGSEVFFSTGTDEHGQKILQKAKEEGRDVQEYVDHYAGEFEKLKTGLNLSYDAFIRTTDERHVAAAQELWRAAQRQAISIKRNTKVSIVWATKRLLKKVISIDGKCPNHPTMTPIEIEEENYFFKLSNYQDRIVEYLSRPEVDLA